MTDEKQVEDLEKRIDELESKIGSMLPVRRDVLKLGLGGLAGASLMSGTASAGSGQVGTIGDSDNRVDLFGEDVDISDTLTVGGQTTFNGPVAGVGGLPTGSIIMWSGSIANIPSGFALCDGNNGTPDLTDRFVVGAGGSEYSVNDTGGEKEVQLTVDELPSHNHNISRGFLNGDSRVEESGGGSSSTPISSSNTGGDQPHENRPPYYALAHIMKL